MSASRNALPGPAFPEVSVAIYRAAPKMRPMRKIFILGHSHITALAHGYKTAPPRPEMWPEMAFVPLNEPQFQPAMQGEALNPAIAAQLHQAQAGVHISLIGGNDHSAIAMLNHLHRFEVVLPEAPDLPVDPAAALLPAGLVLAALAQRIAPHLSLLAAYRAAAPGRLVHIESPPPVPSEAHIREHPGVFRDKIEACGVSPALLRYKFWRLHSLLWREACARLGVEFMTVPMEMCDADGMLVEAAWNPDPTHGNALYGSAVIAKLLREAA